MENDSLFNLLRRRSTVVLKMSQKTDYGSMTYSEYMRLYRQKHAEKIKEYNKMRRILKHAATKVDSGSVKMRTSTSRAPAFISKDPFRRTQTNSRRLEPIQDASCVVKPRDVAINVSLINSTDAYAIYGTDAIDSIDEFLKWLN